MCLSLVPQSNSTYINTPITRTSGIYYEQLQQVKFSENSWELVTYLDLSSFETNFKFLNSTFKKLKTICRNELSNLPNCKPNLNLLNQLIPNINEKEQTLKTLFMSYKREKRALLNIVGSTFKALFGTMDNDDATYYNDAINKVNQDERHLLDLFKQQVQVVSSTVINFNKTISDINNNKEIFSKNFAKLYNFTEQLKTNNIHLEIKQTVDEQFSLLTFMLSELEHEYSNIISSVLFAKSNSVHPLIISPKQLLDELTKTLSFLPHTSSYVLPLELKNIHELMKLTTVKCFFNNNRIIYRISNPLMNTNIYNLYNLIPFPVIKNSLSLFLIIPSINYLAISDDRNTYTTMKKLDVCKIINNFYLCPPLEPFFNTHTRPICETTLLFNIEKIPETCDTRLISSDLELWHKLKYSNSWLYVLPKQIDITISCPSLPVENFTLNKTGILTLDKNCKLFTSSTTLISDNTNYESSIKAIIPDFQIELEDDCCEENDRKQNFNSTENFKPLPLRAINLDKDNLKVVSKKLKQIEEIADEMSNQNKTSNNSFLTNSYFVYLICTLLKLFGLYVLYKLYKYLKNKCKRSSNNEKSCYNIKNCLTFNICKKNEELHVDIDRDLEGSSSSLRKSIRLARLKEKL